MEKMKETKAMHKNPEKMAKRKSILSRMPAKQKLKLAAMAAAAFVLAGAAVNGAAALGVMWLLAFYVGLYGALQAELANMGKDGEKLRQKLLCSESSRKSALCNALLGRAIAARWLTCSNWLLAAACIAKILNVWLASKGVNVLETLI